MVSRIPLEDAVDGPDDYLSSFIEDYGYDDLLLITKDGYIFHSFAQNDIYHTNLLTGDYRDSSLATLFQKAIQNQAFAFSDFELYEANGAQPAAFIAQSSRQGDEPEIIVALQLSLAGLDDIVQDSRSIEDLGETYLVGPDLLMRSDSRIDREKHTVAASLAGSVEENGVDTQASRSALAGESGVEIIEDYRGEEVISSYSPLDVYGSTWALITEIDIQRALSSSQTMVTNFLMTIVIAIALVIALSLLVANLVARPIVMLVETARRLSKGDVELSGLDFSRSEMIASRRDEMGAIGSAFHELIDYFREMSLDASRIAEGDLTVDISPKGDKDILGNAFVLMKRNLRELIGEVSDSIHNISGASMELAQSAEQSGRATGQIATTIQEVARGSQQQAISIHQTSATVDQMARAIDGVAKGAQEQASAVNQSSNLTSQMNEAIQQVSKNIVEVTQDAAEARQAAQDGSQTIEDSIRDMRSIKEKVGISAQRVEEMGVRSSEIGVIIETISDIASQTNLLALNAAIEAARAGEHGKGFAVVADEVRMLAERSANATKEISTLIQNIQITTAEAVEAMEAGSKEVEVGVEHANQAGKSLNAIMESVESVHHQAGEAIDAARRMEQAASELVSAVDSVSAVVEENTAATEEMAAGSDEVTRSIENIASVSEENSAAIEEISASSEEMNTQVEEVSASAQSLAEMAEMLKDAITRFKLK